MLRSTDELRVGFVVHPGVDCMALTAAARTFASAPELKAELLLVSENARPVQGFPFKLPVDWAFGECPKLDILWVPGGAGVADLLDGKMSPACQHFLRKQGRAATMLAGTGTGVLLLAAAGLLDGLQATTHFTHQGALNLYKRVLLVRDQPMVLDGNRLTMGGPGAAIDAALTILAILRGRDVAQATERVLAYEPQPPYGTGSDKNADPVVTHQAHAALKAEREAILDAVVKGIRSSRVR